MSAMEPLCHLFGTNHRYFSKEENILLEAELFVRVCEELKFILRDNLKNYFCVLKFTTEMENAMLESNFARLILQDILSTDDYTLNGIAHYTNTHEDVVTEVATGQNTNPSALFLRKIIELHRSVRQELYINIMKKIAAQYCSI